MYIQYKTYYIRGKEHSDILPFVFNDFMGLEDKDLYGAHPEDIVNALRGLLKEGCKVRTCYIYFMNMSTVLNSCLSFGFPSFTFQIQLNPLSPVSAGDTAYRSDPGLQDQTCCLVYIVATDKVSMMKRDVITKMKNIRESASQLGESNSNLINTVIVIMKKIEKVVTSFPLL